MPAAISRTPLASQAQLVLHINGRRADGYHELQTLFQFIDCRDMLDFGSLKPLN